MMCVPIMAKRTGGALACPTSDVNMGAATLRITKEHDTRVANNKNIQETIPKGIMQRMTAGMNGTNEYP